MPNVRVRLRKPFSGSFGFEPSVQASLAIVGWRVLAETRGLVPGVVLGFVP
jgi:hypothetical protein